MTRIAAEKSVGGLGWGLPASPGVKLGSSQSPVLMFADSVACR